MKTKLALSAVAAAIAVFSQGAFAQASAPATRADVKAGAQAKSVAPAGEKPTAAPSTASDKTRDQRKATTKADAKSGNIKDAGEASGMKDEKAMKSTGSETTKEARKEKTKAAKRPARSSPLAKPASKQIDTQAALRRRSEKRLFGAAFFWVPRSGLRAAGLADIAHRDFGRPLLVELEQLGRLEQLGERRVAVVARIERRLVADLLADRADARPAALSRRRLDGVAQQPDQLGVALELGRRHAQWRARAFVAVSSPVSMSTAAAATASLSR